MHYRLSSILRRLSLCLLLSAAMLALSCSRHSQEDSKMASSDDAEIVLLKAEQLASLGERDQAFDYAISLTDTHAYDMLPSQICRQSLLLYRLSQDGDDAECFVEAIKCYERALEIDSDSVSAFVASLDIRDQYDMRLIHELNMSLNHPQDYSQYELPDSLTLDF